MRIRRSKKPPVQKITFSVGTPPSGPKLRRAARPVSIWPITMLGTLVVITCLAVWFGNKAAPTNDAPASTAVTTVPGTAH